jgi:hypothetical protein
MYHHLIIQLLYVLPKLFICVFCIYLKDTATFATYSVSWLYFITEMKSVYCAVRIGSLNKAVCALCLMVLNSEEYKQFGYL